MALGVGKPTPCIKSKISYRPGLLTVRPTPDVVVVRKRAVTNGHVIVYKDRPDYILKAHHSDYVTVGFTRVSTKKRGRKTTVIYKRGNEQVKLVVKPNRRNWEAHLIAV